MWDGNIQDHPDQGVVILVMADVACAIGLLGGCGSGFWGGQRPRAMSVLSNPCAGGCRPHWAVRSSSSSGMAPRWGSQRASFGLHARGNEECQADTLGLAPVGRPQSLVDMLLSPATPEPPGQATRAIVRCQS
jgi:hypothetical protein